MLSGPLKHAPVHARTEWLHEIVSQGCAALTRHVRDSESRIEANAEELLQDGREQDGVTIIEQVIQTAASSRSYEFVVVQAFAENLPEGFRADGFLVRVLAEGGFTHRAEPVITGRNVICQGKLV